MKKIKLIDLPAGLLFKYNDSIALKSEYRTNNGACQCYLFGTGEMFWGGTNTAEGLNNLLVEPVAIPKEPGAGHNRFVGDRFAPIKVSFEEATLIPEGEEGRWIAYMDDYAGMCCAGKTKEEAFDELMISLKVKIAYDNNIELTRKNP